MGIFDRFKKNKEVKKDDSLLRQVYDYSGITYMSFDEFKSSPQAKDYEFCYTVLVALLAGHSHELYVANRETDMFVDGKIDMKGALAECLSWYRNVKKSDENISFESFKNFMLLDEAEKLNFDVITNRSNKNEFRKVVRAQEADINKRADALMDSMNNIEEEFEGVKRRM